MGDLFLTFFKIGMFTIGGGYVMIPLVRDNCVVKKNWITEDEFMDVLAIAESTPGPIAINMATYVGYKKAGIKGSILSTIGVILPSFICIYIVALIFNDLLKIKIVQNAFVGIRIGVSLIILNVAFDMIKKECKNSKEKKIKIFMFLFSLILVLVGNFFLIHIGTAELIIMAVIFSIIMIMMRRV